jgi:hypothetical protein
MNEPDLFPTGRNYKFIGLYFDPFDAPRQLMALFFTPHACHSEFSGTHVPMIHK